MPYVSAQDSYNRDTNYIDDRIQASADHHDEQTRTWPATAGTYRLVGARACPWAHRAIITRRLLGLDHAISLGLVGPTHDWKSWTFDLYHNSIDPVLKMGQLRAAYLNRYPDYPKGITVPALVDVASQMVITNDFTTLVPDFCTQWTQHHREGAPDLYPENLREEIDQLTDLMFDKVNNGVYKCGFTGSQAKYEEAFHELFSTLDMLEQRLSTQRYLVGEHLTLADVYLYPTLIRFDMVYHNHFKCNRNKISEMPHLWGYLRDLFQTPGFGDTTNFQQIKDHYFLVHKDINPTGVVPVGPSPEIFRSEHGREALGGAAFGDGTAPGAPLPQDCLEGDERF